MNPYTPKPLGNGRFGIFLEGKCIERNLDLERGFIRSALRRALRFKGRFEYIRDAARRCLGSLSREYDIICIEGSGPFKLLGFGPLSELLDIANMETARIADAPEYLSLIT